MADALKTSLGPLSSKLPIAVGVAQEFAGGGQGEGVALGAEVGLIDGTADGTPADGRTNGVGCELRDTRSKNVMVPSNSSPAVTAVTCQTLTPDLRRATVSLTWARRSGRAGMDARRRSNARRSSLSSLDMVECFLRM